MTHFTFLVGRLIFGAFFVWHDIEHVRYGPMMTRFARMKGIAAPETAVLASGAMLILIHNVWTVSGARVKTFERVNFEKNLALAGGAFMPTAIPRAWLFGVQ